MNDQRLSLDLLERYLLGSSYLVLIFLYKLIIRERFNICNIPQFLSFVEKESRNSPCYLPRSSFSKSDTPEKLTGRQPGRLKPLFQPALGVLVLISGIEEEVSPTRGCG